MRRVVACSWLLSCMQMAVASMHFSNSPSSKLTLAMARMRPPLYTLPSHILRQEAYTAAANGACAHAGHPNVRRSLFLSALASQCHTNHCVQDSLCTALIELQLKGCKLTVRWPASSEHCRAPRPARGCTVIYSNSVSKVTRSSTPRAATSRADATHCRTSWSAWSDPFGTSLLPRPGSSTCEDPQVPLSAAVAAGLLS